MLEVLQRSGSGAPAKALSRTVSEGAWKDMILYMNVSRDGSWFTHWVIHLSIFAVLSRGTDEHPGTGGR